MKFSDAPQSIIAVVTVWDTAVRITEHVVVRTGKPYLYYLRETLHV
jgi:hypothetical protein